MRFSPMQLVSNGKRRGLAFTSFAAIDPRTLVLRCSSTTSLGSRRHYPRSNRKEQSEELPWPSRVNRDNATRRATRLHVELDVGELFCTQVDSRDASSASIFIGIPACHGWLVTFILIRRDESPKTGSGTTWHSLHSCDDNPQLTYDLFFKIFCTTLAGSSMRPYPCWRRGNKFRLAPRRVSIRPDHFPAGVGELSVALDHDGGIAEWPRRFG